MFVEGNIKATLNKQKCGMVPLCRKTDWDPLKNTCIGSVVHSTACDMSINDFFEELRKRAGTCILFNKLKLYFGF